MKKVILLLLLILPVAIVAASFAIAGAVGRGIMIPEIESVYLSDHDGFYGIEGYREVAKNRYRLTAEVEGKYELGKYFAVVPEKAKFTDLKFTSSNADAVKVEGDKIIVMQNMRVSDGGSILIRAAYMEKEFFAVEVEINPDYDRFDHFGYIYELLEQAVSGSDWPGTTVKISNSCRVNTNAGYLIIDRAKLVADTGGAITDFGRLLRNGLDLAPFDLLYNVNPLRKGFANSLTFISGDAGILSIAAPYAGVDEINVFSASVLSEGDVDITIKTAWLGRQEEVTVKVSII